MTALPPCPQGPRTLYEINTRIWLRELGVATLRAVPDRALDEIAGLGFDLVWLMGVWAPSPHGQQIARTHPALPPSYRAALPDLRDEDVVASPYALVGYVLSSALGTDEDLADLRRRLARRGMGLVLDFVPNHTAVDHPDVVAHPERYVLAREGAGEGAVKNGEAFVGGGQAIFHGRDPYFPPWTDTAQLDYRRVGTRQAQIAGLLSVAGRCDGVRCDMAMLLLSEIFACTWERPEGVAAQPVPDAERAKGEFWAEAIDAVRARHPGFLFMAEAYWGTERRLQQLGFDYTYDKTLYDRLLELSAPAVNAHLSAGRSRQRRFVRFLENHDEDRIADRLKNPEHRVAAMATFFLPGLRLFHEGQLAGVRRRVPVQLQRRMSEGDKEIAAFYRQLLCLLSDPVVRQGSWRLLPALEAWPGNGSQAAWVIYGWDGSSLGLDFGLGRGGGHRLMGVNLANHQAQCRVRLALPGLAGRRVRITQLLGAGATPTGDTTTEDGSPVYLRDGDELAEAGFFLDLPGHTGQLLAVGP